MKLLERASGPVVASVSVTWVLVVAASYGVIRYWWAVREANTRLATASDMRMSLRYVQYTMEPMEQLLVLLLLVLPPAFLGWHWRAARKRREGPLDRPT